MLSFTYSFLKKPNAATFLFSNSQETVKGRPLILSLSRRTDLVGWYPRRTVDRVRRRLDGLRQRWLYGTVFWTRFPRRLLEPPLRDLLETDLHNTVVNLTLTGLGGTRLEPRVPRTGEVLACLPDLIDLLGGPERLRWRWDPMLYRQATLTGFGQLAERMAALGVPTCTVSFPAARSLKGSLAPFYERAGLAPWPDRQTQTRFLKGLARIARGLGIRLLVCSQPWFLSADPWLEPAQCIPLEVLVDGHPDGLSYPAVKDPSQRRHCTCPASEDLGDYRTDLCRSGCVYCYSPAGGPEPRPFEPMGRRKRVLP